MNNNLMNNNFLQARTTLDLRPFKDTNMNRHDVLFPGFIKSTLNTRVVSQES